MRMTRLLIALGKGRGGAPTAVVEEGGREMEAHGKVRSIYEKKKRRERCTHHGHIFSVRG